MSARNVLEIYVMLSPLVVLALALSVYRLTGWLDKRDDARRGHAAE
ncbi:MAG: hypothetical protein OJF62_001799 [Pseudolabrys sp.]|jgi:hypothetical protein|nr:hypothetical protein [Pseudolabrys sp.]